MRLHSVLSLASASPRRLLIGLGGMLIASALAVGSAANFNSSSANPGALITGATIAVSDSLAGSSVVSVGLMKPGGSTTGTVTIRNGGNVPVALTLGQTNLVDTPASPPLSGKLVLQVQDLGDPSCTVSCPTPLTVYSGTLGSMTTLALGQFAASAQHAFKFTVTFPDGGAGGADNAYGGSSTRSDYRWTATQ